MPGITGIIGRFPSGDPADAVQTMVDCMLHEPFYVSGTLALPELGGWFGWTSRGRPQLNVPTWNRTRDVCLVLAGETFVTDAARRCAGAESRHLPADAPALLLQLYEEIGPEFLCGANGWFSGLLVDRRLSRVLLFNDRYGLGRLYYHEYPNGFCFSSEAKSILRVIPRLRDLDPRGVGEFLSCGCVLQNRTLFPGVRLVPGASLWTFGPGGATEKKTYFDKANWEKQVPLNESEFGEGLAETFAAVVPRYFGGDAPVGMSLTGGLDGRMIMAFTPRPSGTMPCYTFGGPFRECADVKVARRVAGVCRQPHQVLQVDGNFLQEFPRLAEKTVYIGDGTMDVSGAAELFANRMAREIAPVRMTGNYGSEIIRGYIAFRPVSWPEGILSSEFSPHLLRAGTTYAEELGCPRQAFIAFKQVPWHHYARLSIEQSQVAVRSPYLDADLVRFMFRVPEKCLSLKEPSFQVIARGNPRLNTIPTDRGLVFPPRPARTRLANRFQEFTAKAEYAYDYGMPHWLARLDRTLAPLHLERVFLGRHKFCHYRLWYRQQLAPYLKEMLLTTTAGRREYLAPGSLAAMVLDHTAGRANFTKELHKLLTLELVHRTLLKP